MSASAHSPAEAALSTSAGLVGVGPAGGPPVPPQPLEAKLPRVGQTWREHYEVVEEIRAESDGHAWRGRVLADGTEVQLRAFRSTEPELRAQAWTKLSGIDSPHLQRARDTHRCGEWTVEVANAPQGERLDVWRTRRGPVDEETLRTIVSQLTDALGALHAFELVHLGLRPDVIYVTENGASVHCLVGGLVAVTGFDRSEAISAAVDPLYAPPEAVGLTAHRPGPGLCAWDWWSLGRVFQELILGRHIVTQLSEALAGADARSRAEQLLLEVDPKAPRAGAVERMGELSSNVRLLLRGLLTTTQDSRWTGDNVDRWIRGLPVRDHYDVPRSETHFRWRGRPYTVGEIAVVLQSAEHWGDNHAQLFEQTTPGTLAHFLRWSPNQSAAQEQLLSALELAEALPLKLATPTAQRETVIMVALMQLSAGQLVWRGRLFDASTLATMMDELGEAEALTILRGLTMRSTALQIERVDAAAGRLLTELGRTIGDVESILKRHGWFNPNDAAGVARIFRLAAQPLSALRAARESLAETFAGSDHPAMEKVFRAQSAGRAELVVLAWASTDARKFKFYDHAEAARRRAEALRARGAELNQALTWARLEAALQAGRLVLGGWGTFLLAWLIVGLVATVAVPGPRGVALLVLPALVAFVIRVLVAPIVRRELGEAIPGATWTWRDAPERCRRELKRAGGGEKREVLAAERKTVEEDLAALRNLQPPPGPLPSLPRFSRVRGAAIGSWLLLLLWAGGAGWRFHGHPFAARDFKAAWNPPKPPKDRAQPTPTSPATADKETDIKVSWPYRPGDHAQKVSVARVVPATSEQVAYATKHGRELVAPYRADSITTAILLPVPAGDMNAVMIFDGKRGELFNQQLYIVEFRPLPRDWVEVDGHKGVYLDR